METATAVIDPPATELVDAPGSEAIAEAVAQTDVIPDAIEMSPPLPALEIISLERIDRSNLPARAPQSWRYSISRWAYRWWLWTRETFRHCFPVSKQR